MAAKPSKNKIRIKKHKRVRRKISGTAERPRLCIYRSLSNIYAQLIDDDAGHTLAAASSLESDARDEKGYGGNKAAARKVGLLIGKRALEKGIKSVVFDRS